ncbi:Hsp20/alpha crystallin family protein [Sulfurospirillum sp. 1307]|jgi:HSP20 family protein
MLLTRFEPMRELRELRKGFEYMNSIMNELEGQGSEVGISSFVPSVNSREAKDAYHIEIDLPGIKKDDISIDIKDNVLTVSGERKVRDEISEDSYYKVESSYGKFIRSFTLPKNVDVDKIEANSENGVLEIKIPKQEVIKDQPKKIKIK